MTEICAPPKWGVKESQSGTFKESSVVETICPMIYWRGQKSMKIIGIAESVTTKINLLLFVT
jgi:hypothetical protein